MDEVAIREAVEALQLYVEGDGAQIQIAQLDEETKSVHLRLDFAQVECLDCVMPPAILGDIIEGRLRTADPSVGSVIVEDPRNLPAT